MVIVTTTSALKPSMEDIPLFQLLIIFKYLVAILLNICLKDITPSKIYVYE